MSFQGGDLIKILEEIFFILIGALYIFLLMTIIIGVIWVLAVTIGELEPLSLILGYGAIAFVTVGLLVVLNDVGREVYKKTFKGVEKMEIRDNTIEFEDLDGRDMFAAVVSDGQSGYFTIAISYNQEHQVKLDSKLPDNKKITNGNLMERAQKIITHWIFEKGGVLSDFDISQEKFIDLIKYNKINNIFFKDGKYVIQSKSNKSDFHNLVLSNETIREELYLSNGSSMGSILYSHGNPLKEETDGEYLNEETRREYERINQSINGMNDIFEMISESCTDQKISKNEIWNEIKQRYNLNPEKDYYYDYGLEKIVNRSSTDEISVEDDIVEKFFDNLIDKRANQKMIAMFHRLLSRKEKKSLMIMKEIGERYKRPIKDINTATGEIIFKEV